MSLADTYDLVRWVFQRLRILERIFFREKSKTEVGGSFAIVPGNQQPTTSFSRCPSPEVLEELLNVWLKNTGVCPLDDLQAGVQWARRLWRDSMRENCNVEMERKRKREHEDNSVVGHLDEQKDNAASNSTYADQHMNEPLLSSQSLLVPENTSLYTEKNLFPSQSSLCAGEETKGVNYYLRGIESIIHRCSDSCQEATQQISEETCLPQGRESGVSSKNRVATGRSANTISIVPSGTRESRSTDGNSLIPNLPRSLQGGGATSETSAVEDASRARFGGPDKLFRFESQVLTNITKPPSGRSSNSRGSKLDGKSLPSKM